MRVIGTEQELLHALSKMRLRGFLAHVGYHVIRCEECAPSINVKSGAHAAYLASAVIEEDWYHPSAKTERVMNRKPERVSSFIGQQWL